MNLFFLFYEYGAAFLHFQCCEWYRLWIGICTKLCNFSVAIMVIRIQSIVGLNFNTHTLVWNAVDSSRVILKGDDFSTF